MSETPCHLIDAHIGFFARRVTCRLLDDHVEILNGTRATRIGYRDLSSISLFRQSARRTIVGLTSTAGTTTRIRLASSSGSDDKVAAFTRSLVESVARVAPQTPLRLGPDRRQWIAAWIGLAASVAILLGAAWAFFVGTPMGPVLLPVGIGLVNLAVVVPILQSGRPRHCVVNTAPVTLV
jgi:hypothetical protein